MLVDDPKLFSDSEITLRDVLRAQEIVERANKIMQKAFTHKPVDTMSWSIAPSPELDKLVEKIVNS